MYEFVPFYVAISFYRVECFSVECCTAMFRIMDLKLSSLLYLHLYHLCVTDTKLQFFKILRPDLFLLDWVNWENL